MDKFLLITPNDDLEQLFRDAIALLDIVLFRCVSGNEALIMIGEIQPDYVFSDYDLEDMDGLIFFQELHRRHLFGLVESTPFFFISEEKYRKEMGLQLFERGVKGWFVHPLNSDTLKELIQNTFWSSKVLEKNRELKQQVRRSEHKYRDLLENASDLIFTLDNYGKFVYLNNRFTSLTGYDKSMWINKPFIELFEPSVRDSAQEFYNSIHHGRARIFEANILHQSNRTVNMSLNMTPLFERGEITGAMAIGRDITHVKQMQSEVFRMDRLASLGVLASGIAHEIKNPLAGIKTLAQACREEFDPEDDRLEYLQRIERQVNRLNALLNTFFTFAKPKTPDRHNTPVAAILKEIKPLTFKKMQEFNIRFVETMPRHSLKIFVDPQQLQQVILNLFLNAIEAMPDGGQLTFSAFPVQKETADDINTRMIRLSVKDTGIGIQQDKLEQIYDPFFTTKSNGTGLGLSIVFRIIEEHHGYISVISQPNQGAEFIIDLPAGE